MNLNFIKKTTVDKKGIFDLIIVGAGPAGMTSAIYAARRKLNFCIVSLDVGGQMSWSLEVANYPGTTHCTGIELTKNFQKHLSEYKVNIKQEEVSKIFRKGNLINVQTKNNSYNAKTVIIGTGKTPKKLGVHGEEKLLGKGVNYCATCDAPAYKGKNVAVIGGGNSGLEAALYLAKYAKKVYIVELGKKLAGVPYLKEKVKKERKIQLANEAKTIEILGDKSVTGLKIQQAGKEKTLKVEGIFIEIGLITKADFIDVKKNKRGEIRIYRSTNNTDENLTSEKGIFAAGDVTDIPDKQIVIAAGEGAKALLAAVDYIHRWDKKFG